MKINTALILCAGYGKRLSPLTLDIPKPLLEINNITLLENTINLLQDLKDAGLKLKDLKTEQSTLEKIFVSLVKENNEI